MARRSTSWGTEEPAPEPQADVPEFKDAGYEETLPGQVEVVAGTPQHERVPSGRAAARRSILRHPGGRPASSYSKPWPTACLS